MSEDFMYNLYSSNKKVFRLSDIAAIDRETKYDNLKSKVFYYVKKGLLNSPRRGIYTLGSGYSIKELASSIYTPCYLSFETVLREEGAIFQNYRGVYLASYLTREIELGGNRIFYRKLKDEILTNPAGIKNTKSGSVASVERAVLDMLYLVKDYYFDNLTMLNWDKAYRLLSIYNQKNLEQKLNFLKEEYVK
jgi:hypothetical protein